MIYVLVEESGEYSSYNKDNIFASLSEDVIKAKLVEYEKFENIRQEMSKTYHDLLKEYTKENPYPIGQTKEKFKEYADKRNVWINSTTKELGKKYNIDNLDWSQMLYADRWYSIEEVESD